MGGDAQNISWSEPRWQAGRPSDQVALPDNGDFPALLDPGRSRCHGDDRDDVQRPGKLEKCADLLTGPPSSLDLTVPPVAVSPERSVSDRDPSGPVLRIHDEDAGRTDGHMVDVGSLTAWPSNVVEDVETVGAEELELFADSLFAGTAAVPHLGGVLSPFGALDQFSRLGTQALCPGTKLLRLLAC
jgi:hypothetical protein